MKKILLFIFTFLYLGIAIGANLTYGYCMDRLVDVSMTEEHSHASCAMCEGGDHENNCCDSEQEFVKLSVDQNTPVVTVQDFTPVVMALLYNLNDLSLLSEYEQPIQPFGNHPPLPLYSAPLFVRNCVFLI